MKRPLIALMVVAAMAAPAFADPNGDAADLTESGALEISDPFTEQFEQDRRTTIEELNLFYEEESVVEAESGLFDGFEDVLDTIEVRSTREENTRGTQSIGVNLTSF